MFPPEIFFRIFRHVIWQDILDPLYYSSRWMMTLVRQWKRSSDEYPNFAMRHGFLEILDPLELGICTDSRIDHNGPYSDSPRTMKLISWSLTRNCAQSLTYKHGRPFWDWATINRPEVLRPEMRLAFEFISENITSATANVHLEIAFRYNRYIREVVDAVAAIEHSPGLPGMPDAYDLSRNPTQYKLDPSRNNEVSDEDYKYLLTHLNVRSLTLLTIITQENRLELIQWIVNRVGRRVITPHTVKVAFEWSTRSIIEYITSVNYPKDTRLNHVNVKYADLDLFPSGKRSLSIICSHTMDSHDISPAEQISWLSTHLRRISGYIEFSGTISYEVLKTLCEKFRLKISPALLMSYSASEIHDIAPLLDKLPGIISCHTMSPEKLEALRSHGITIRDKEPSSTTRSPIITWDFSSYTACRHQLPL